ncbi:MAG: HEAT repeat domain-containing protein [Chlamydiales bacterium]|nr:HEAT repeat domain-containing protein [Chlamydiales bacterium]
MLDEALEIQKKLAKVGIVITDIYELVNSPHPYPNAIPVLIDLLHRGISQDTLKEGIIRALAVKEAKGKAGKILIEEFNKIPQEKVLLRWAIGNTIEIIIANEDVPGILEIIRNKANGISRQMFVLALGKVKSEDVLKTLVDLLADNDLVIHALEALGKLKAITAKKEISLLLNHPKAIVRKKAQQILKKL